MHKGITDQISYEWLNIKNQAKSVTLTFKTGA